METSPFRQRRFSAAEVRPIVRRAAALAERDPETPAAEQSLSQAELEQTATSLGLPASAVRAAIADQAPDDAAEGLPKADSHRILLEEELDGEMPADRHEDLV